MFSRLEVVRRLSKADQQVGDFQKGREYLRLVPIPNDDSAVVSAPRQGAFDGPAAAVAMKRSAILWHRHGLGQFEMLGVADILG